MAEATVEKIAAPSALSLTANCTACLTRDCPLAGCVDSPVSLCSSYRQVNCYLCTQADCALTGTLNSPVLACSQFQPIAIA